MWRGLRGTGFRWIGGWGSERWIRPSRSGADNPRFADADLIGTPILVAKITASGYFSGMIKSFGDKDTQRLFEGGRIRKLPSDIQERSATFGPDPSSRVS